jgi:endonuclease/exonuclease/phosphatase family metal-dependent hydrolase
MVKLTSSFGRTFLATWLCTVTLGSQAGASVAAEPARDKADLLVMTFNIRYGTANDGENNWDQRKDLAVDVLRRHHPDVVGLQEALRSQLDDLRAALPEYGEIGVGRDDGQTRGEYSAIFYRKDRFDVNDCGTFWLSDTPEVPGSITWGNNCTRLCTWARFLPKASGPAFYLFNTHLDHISQLSRDKGVLLLAERMQKRKHQDPVVVTGDLNAGEDNPVVRYLKGEGTLDVARNGLAKNPVPLRDTLSCTDDSRSARSTASKALRQREDRSSSPWSASRPAAIPRLPGLVPSDHFR